MGLFKGREVFTSSVVYNLAGPEEDRANYLKSAIVARTLSGSGESMADFLGSVYRGGPGSKLKKFHRWALNNYQQIGVPNQIKLTINSALEGDIRQAGQTSLGFNITVTGSEIAHGNWSYWAEQYMLTNHRALIDSEWEADIDETTGDITITFEDTTTATFTPADYDPEALYIYATYTYAVPGPNSSVSYETNMWFYKVGSGDPVLDPLVAVQTSPSEAFFPVIPVRINNEFVSDTYKPHIFALAKKALDKAIGADLSELQTTMEDENEDLSDIDYAYIVFGVPLNVKEPAAREYLWKAFYELWEEENDTSYLDDYTGWQHATSIAGDAMSEFQSTTQEFIDDEGGGNQPDPLTLIPSAGPTRPWRGIQIRPPHSGPTWDTNYDVRISWSAVKRKRGIGLYKPDAEVGDIWFEKGETYSYDVGTYDQQLDLETEKSEDTVTLIRQFSEHNWESIEVFGLVQQTRVFGDHYEELKAFDEIEDGDASSFLWPLRYSTYSELSLKNATQMATSCTFLTLHSYEIVVQRWYQTIALQIVFTIALIAVTAASGGLGAAGAGLLGSNLAVGAALGFVGSAAIAIGFIANYIAAIVLTSLVMKASTAVFGDKLGRVIGTIVAMVAINITTNFANNGNFALNFGNMTTASSLLKLTQATSGAYSAYMNASTQDLILKNQELLETYQEDMKELSELYAENIGYDTGMVNPMLLTDAQNIFIETPESFFSRTLMTGSDIAELTHEMLSNFADITIKSEID